MHLLQRMSRAGMAAGLWAAACIGAHAAAPPYNTVAPYNLAALGVPKFINTNYIDTTEVIQLTKFRSDSGHDYSDQLEFGTEATRDSNGKVESCRSMKHYFYGVDRGTPIYAPVSGTITAISPAPTGDVQVGLQPDAEPAFGINIFHVTQDAPLTVGEHVTEGQRLGTHPGAPYIASDIAVFVKTTTGFHLISYFEALTDAAFAPWKARGVNAASDLIYSAEQRDAAPYQCGGLAFINVTSDPSLDYVTLTVGAATQTLSFSYNALPTLLRTSDPPTTIAATASSGLPVSIVSTTPTICTASGLTLTGIAGGTCQYQLTQPGVLDQYHSITYSFSATVIAGMNAGPIYASTQSDRLSFLRFYNTGTSAGTITATLYHGTTGAVLAQWTSPSIPAGAEYQVPVATIEGAIAPGIPLPQTYSLLVQAGITGYFQHALWQPNVGTIANLTTCAFGNGSDPSSLSAVHSTVMSAFGYPSTIVVHNTGDAGAVVLDIYDARTGKQLGSYTTDTIPANGSAILPVSVLEAGAKIVPSADMPHYVIKAESPFTGFLQHLLTNVSGVTTDMTAQCTLDASTPLAAFGSMRSGLVYSSNNRTQRSYIRIGSTNYAGTNQAKVTFIDPSTGQALGTWTSPSLPYGTGQQFAVADMESALDPTIAKPDTYVLSFDPGFSGYYQHVVWNLPLDTITNVTTCSTGVRNAAPLEAPFVMSSLLPAYPSTLSLNSTQSATSKWFFAYRDIRNSNYVVSGVYNVGGSLTLAANASDIFTVASSEKSLLGPFTPPAGMLFYQTEPSMDDPVTGFPVPGGGYVQDLVASRKSGIVDNITATCPLY